MGLSKKFKMPKAKIELKLDEVSYEPAENSLLNCCGFQRRDVIGGVQNRNRRRQEDKMEDHK